MNVRFDRIARGLLTLTLLRRKAEALGFTSAATELGVLGTWLDPDGVSDDSRAETVVLEVEYGEVTGETIGHVIVLALGLINNLEVNERVLYARMIDVEQSTLTEQREVKMKKPETFASNLPTLETERLLLRPLSGGDVDAPHRISNEPLVRRYLWDDEPVSKAKIEEVVAQSTRMFSEEGLGLFGVRLRSAEEPVGFCGFLRLEGMEEAKLGCELLPGLWGQGIATEAARACLRHAFKEVGLNRAIAGADEPNIASLRVIEKLGMRPAGNINPSVPEAPYYVLYRREFFAPVTAGA